jgi:hypothetical protein
MAVVAILISLLSPTLWSVRETARRVLCGSNIRQLGIGIALYADDNHDRLPPSQFIDNKDGKPVKPQEMLHLRVDKQADGVSQNDWDGLGHLYSGNYLPEPHIFYCPSHKGQITFGAYAARWDSEMGSIVGNYQYRGSGPMPNHALFLSRIEPGTTALVSDGLRTQSDYNHRIGGNVLRADLSVQWYRDASGGILAALPAQDGDVDAGKTEDAWKLLDLQLGK